MPSIIPFNFFQGGIPTGDYTSTGIYGDIWYRVIGAANGNFPENYTILRFREFAEEQSLGISFDGDFLPATAKDVATVSFGFGGEFIPKDQDEGSYSIGFTGQPAIIAIDRVPFTIGFRGEFGVPGVDRVPYSFNFHGELTGTFNDRFASQFSWNAKETGATFRDSASSSFSFYGAFTNYLDDQANIEVEIASGIMYRDVARRIVDIEDEATIICTIASCKLYKVSN